MKVSNVIYYFIFVCLIFNASISINAMEPPQKKARVDKYEQNKKKLLGASSLLNLLSLAVQHDRVDDAKALLDLGMNPNHHFDFLSTAARYNSYKVASLLLERGADVNSSEWDGDAPIHEAVRKGNTEVLKVILQYKPDVNIPMWGGDNNAPLEEAVFYNHPACVKLLVAAGANMTNKSLWRDTALHWGARRFDCTVELVRTPSDALLSRAKTSLKTLLMVFKRFEQQEGCGVALPKEIQRYICRTYLTQLQFEKVNPLCGVENFQGKTAYDIARTDKRHDIAELVDPNDATARRILIWDSIGTLMAGNAQQEDTEHERE